MADFTKLNSAIADVSAKLDAHLAQPAPVVPDVQPEIDAATTAVEALAAKIPVPAAPAA